MNCDARDAHSNSNRAVPPMLAGFSSETNSFVSGAEREPRKRQFPFRDRVHKTDHFILMISESPCPIEGPLRDGLPSGFRRSALTRGAATSGSRGLPICDIPLKYCSLHRVLRYHTLLNLICKGDKGLFLNFVPPLPPRAEYKKLFSNFIPRLLLGSGR